MAYNENIPNASDTPSGSQPQLRANFQAIKSLVEENHGAFGDSAQGKHIFVSMPERGSSPTTAVNECALFTRNSPLTSQAEIAYRRPGDGSSFDLTASVLTNNPSTASTEGWTVLPSGIVLQWGQTTGTGTTNVTITGNNMNQVLSVQITTVDNTSTTYIDKYARFISYSGVGFSVFCGKLTGSGAETVTFNWFAIGRQ